MPNWKKLVVSGSDASLNSLNVNTTVLASTISGSQLRLDENGTGLRMTNVGAFDNSSGDFRIFSTEDLIISTNGDSGTAVTFKKTSKNAEFEADVIAFSSSDERFKDNITPINNPIEKIKKIGGYKFDWNEKSSHEGHDVGVIAQEIEEILPEIVTTRDNGYKAVKYDKIVALLIEGIKDQQLQIDELKSQLNKKG